MVCRRALCRRASVRRVSTNPHGQGRQQMPDFDFRAAAARHSGGDGDDRQSGQRRIRTGGAEYEFTVRFTGNNGITVEIIGIVICQQHQ